MSDIRLERLKRSNADEDVSESDEEVDLELQRHRHDRIITEVGEYERKRKRRMFYTQLLLSLLVILFSMGMLGTNFNCDTQSAFIPLITFVMGFWLPQPRP